MLKKHQKLISLVLIAIALSTIIGFFYYQYSQKRTREFRVTFLNIGQGDAALINFSNGEKMLVDCGPSAVILSALGRNLPFWDRKIDYVLNTHSDLDHYGGCIDVLKRYEVKNIITNGRVKPNDPYWVEWDRAMKIEVYRDGRGVLQYAPTMVITSHQIWNIASSSLEFFSPDDSLNLDAKADDSNNYSIVFRLYDHGRDALNASQQRPKSFLFTGDMEFLLENALISKYCSTTANPLPALSVATERDRDLPSVATEGIEGRTRACPLQADILKVGHHGSPGSTSEEFLAKVRPQTAVISVGKNKFGHPSLRVIRHLERAGANILRTDQNGDIVMQ